MKLKERFPRERPDWEHPLGPLEAQPRPLPAGHEDRTELAGTEGFDAAHGSGHTRSRHTPCAVADGTRSVPATIVPATIQSDRGRRRFGAGSQLMHVALSIAALEQPAHQVKIDRLDLPGQRFLLVSRERIPEGQQMLVTVRAGQRG